MSYPPESPSEEIAAVLRERIVEGRYAPGAPLIQSALAEELTVSRGVVSDALRLLRREGLVDGARPGAGARVMTGGCSVLLSAYAVREVLDGLAARLAASHPAPRVQERLAVALAELGSAASSGDRLRYKRACMAFRVLPRMAHPGPGICETIAERTSTRRLGLGDRSLASGSTSAGQPRLTGAESGSRRLRPPR